MPISKPTNWWRRARNPRVWHFMKNCPSSPKQGTLTIVTSTRPRDGTKCDHCQRLQKAAKGK